MSDAELHQMLGGLRANVEHLTQTINNMASQWANQEKNASEGRRILHQKVDGLKEVATGLSQRVGKMEETLEGIKPAVKQFEDQRLEQKGAMKLGKLLWTGMLAAAGTMGGAITWGLQHWMSFTKPP